MESKQNTSIELTSPKAAIIKPDGSVIVVGMEKVTVTTGNLNIQVADEATREETWRDRFVREYRELSERIVKLRKMIALCESKGQTTLDNTPVWLLEAQLNAMKTFKIALDLRCEYEGHQP